MTPLQLSLAAGPVLSHMVEPLADKIPATWRPTLIAVGMGASTAGVAMLSGKPWPVALGLGLGTCLSGKVACAGATFSPGQFFLVPATLEDRLLTPAAPETTLLRTRIP